MAQQPASFLSYCREDSDFAHRLAGDLKAAGSIVWLDFDIVPGQQWDRAVEEALASSQRMVVVLSPAAVNSTNVMDEVSFALDEKKTIIPIIYRDCTVPFRLRRVQYVDFRQDYARGLQDLVRTLAPEHAVRHAPPAISAMGDQTLSTVEAGEDRRHVANPTRTEQEKQRTEEEALLEEDRRKSAEATRLEEARRRTAEEARAKQERQRVDERRREEERRKAAEAKRLEEERTQAAEQARVKQERQRTAERARVEDERRQQLPDQSTSAGAPRLRPQRARQRYPDAASVPKAIQLLVLVVMFASAFFGFWVASRFTDIEIIVLAVSTISLMLPFVLYKEVILPWLIRDSPNDA
jgi:hypothetical protein